MWLRLLVPLTLLWPVLALAAEGTALRRFRATPAKEMMAMLFCIVGYFALWIVLDWLVEALTGAAAAGIITATILSLGSLPLLLYLGFRIFGVRAGTASPAR
jgi:hypothetical protein